MCPESLAFPFTHPRGSCSGAEKPPSLTGEKLHPPGISTPPTAHRQASRSLRWGPECVEEEGSLGAWANS